MHIMLKRDAKSLFLKSVFDVDFIGFLKKKFAKEHLVFGARTTINRVEKGQSVKLELPELENLIVWAYIDQNNISSVIITDKDYPESAVKIGLKKLVKEFYETFPKFDESSVEKDLDLKMPQLDVLIKKFQDPKEADKLLKVEADLDEIHVILQKTLKDMLNRGESLDELMKQSDDISTLAHQFHANAKASNQKCCSIY